MTEAAKIRKPRHPRKSGKWYSEGLRFTCKQCAACCSGEPGFVWVTESDIEKIAKYLGMRKDEMEGRYIRPTGSGNSLVELPNGNCVFLLDKQCGI